MSREFLNGNENDQKRREIIDYISLILLTILIIIVIFTLGSCIF